MSTRMSSTTNGYGARVLTFATVNAWNLYDTDAHEGRYAALEALIQALDVDVLAVQEIVARPSSPSDPAVRSVAEQRLHRLAEAIDRRCEVDGQPTLAVGGGSHHAALLWRDGITPVNESLDRFERAPAGMWHSMVTAVLDVGGPRLRIGSVQLSPFDPGMGWGWRDAGQVLRAMHRDSTPGLIGGDWNALGSDPAYDPDPYADAAWHPDHAYQYGPDGRLDRSAARRLEEIGRMRDCARIVDAPWTPTTGHHPVDHHPPRRIDRWYATHHVPDAALVGYRVADSYAVGATTDHLPVLVTLDPAALP